MRFKGWSVLGRCLWGTDIYACIHAVPDHSLIQFIWRVSLAMSYFIINPFSQVNWYILAICKPLEFFDHIIYIYIYVTVYRKIGHNAALRRLRMPRCARFSHRRSHIYIYIIFSGVGRCFGIGGAPRVVGFFWCFFFLWFKSVHVRNYLVRLSPKIMGWGGGGLPKPLYIYMCVLLVSKHKWRASLCTNEKLQNNLSVHF